LEPANPLIYCYLGKSQIALNQQEKALENLNMAFEKSKNLVPIEGLTEENISFINKTLNYDR
jgi:hypothetical protein